MRSQSRSLLDILVRKSLHPALKDRGFRRKGRTWNRQANELVQVINVQASRWNEGNSGYFTVNLGVFVPAVYLVIWGREPPPFVAEEDCVVRCRIGTVINCEDPVTAYTTGEQRDNWWQFDEAIDLEEMGNEVVNAILTYGLHFLQASNSLEKIKYLLLQYCKSKQSTPWDHVYLAIVDAIQGNETTAKERLVWVSSKYGSYRERILQIAKRLNIGLDT